MAHTCQAFNKRHQLFFPLAPGDYTGITSRSLSFGPSDTLLRVTVPITNDNAYELDETFSAVLTISSRGLGVVVCAQQAMVTIYDDDSKFTSSGDIAGHGYISSYSLFCVNVSGISTPKPGLTIRFVPPTYTVGEGGVAMLRIVKIGEADYPVSVDLSTVDGTAVGKTYRLQWW